MSHPTDRLRKYLQENQDIYTVIPSPPKLITKEQLEENEKLRIESTKRKTTKKESE